MIFILALCYEKLQRMSPGMSESSCRGKDYCLYAYRIATLTESPSSTFYTVECDCNSVFQTVYLDK